jgi:hypothetical protein
MRDDAAIAFVEMARLREAPPSPYSPIAMRLLRERYGRRGALSSARIAKVVAKIREQS